MPTCEIEFRVPEFNQWPLNREPSAKFLMEKARGASRQGAGKALPNWKLPFSWVATKQPKNWKKIDEMYHELNQSGQLRDTVKLILEHFR